MKKIQTLFKRDFYNGGKILSQYSDDVAWVVAGVGIATRKYDGMCSLVRDGKLYRRYELKEGRTAPADFEPIDHDETTGKTMGWVQVGWGNEDKYFREAAGDPDNVDLKDGTYELLGPKVQGNPEHFSNHVLLSHDQPEVLYDVPTDFYALCDYLEDKDIEGIVWHNNDGRMVKIKKKDYGLKR